jgi:hypothetical protein
MKNVFVLTTALAALISVCGMYLATLHFNGVR